MKKCIIIDDEENCRILLKELLKEHGGIETIMDTGDALEAYRLITEKKLTPDLVFLDVQMPGCDGFEFLGKFPSVPFQVIFTTAYDQYAMKAIRFSALDYLLKPVDPEQISEALDRFGKTNRATGLTAMNHFKAHVNGGNLPARLAIPSISEINFIEVKEIIYLESDSNYTVLHIHPGEKIISSKNIGYYEELLDGMQFFRVHNSYLVNMKKIRKYMRGKTGMIEMDNGVRLTISTRRKEEFLGLLNLI